LRIWSDKLERKGFKKDVEGKRGEVKIGKEK